MIAADMPPSIFTDSRRLEQILKNLLSNAVKFTDAGTIELALGLDSGNRVRFAVTDSGIGIAPEHQQTIFEAFRQADGTTSRRYGGTGLGLSISRDLATLLGGAIRVSSTLGAGSTFELTLPTHWTGASEPIENVRVIAQPAARTVIDRSGSSLRRLSRRSPGRKTCTRMTTIARTGHPVAGRCW